MFKLVPIIILFIIGFQTKSDNISVVDFEGLKPYLNKQNDTTYIINFWATWCKPCVKELPYFEQINENYKSKKVKVILVSLDFPKNFETTLIPFVQRKGIKSQVILLNDPDSNSWINQIDKNWSGAIPATLIYNKKTRNFYEKSFDYERLDSTLKLIHTAY